MIKKALLVFLTCLVVVSGLFAEDKSVCICPYNSELGTFLSKGLGIKVNQPKQSFDTQTLLNGDVHVVEMVLKDSNSDILLVPEITLKDNLNLFKIYIWDVSLNQMNQIHTSLSQMSKSFDIVSVFDILPYVSERKVGLVQLKDFKSGSSVKIDNEKANPINEYLFVDEGKHEIAINAFGHSEIKKMFEVKAFELIEIDSEIKEQTFSDLTLKSSVKASVIKDSVVLGTTPFSLDSYTVPSVLRLRAEGYSDALISIKKETKEINVQLKPAWMENSEVYTDARKSFYLSFARSILIYGAKVVCTSLKSIYPEVSMIGERCATVAMAVSIGDLVYDLINYSRYAEYTSP